MRCRNKSNVLSGLVLLALISNVAADEYRNARIELAAAYQQGNYAAMRVAARKALAARPGYPVALFNLALAQVLDDDPAASLQTLRDLWSIGVDFAVADIDEFATLKNLLEWDDYAAAVRRLYEPIGFAEVVATLNARNFIPEGIALDSDGHFYLGSIRKGELVRIGESPQTLSTPKDGHWSVFGMRFDTEGGLWFASAAVPQFADAADAVGQSGLFRYDLKRGEISDKALLPASDDAQLIGDLVLAPSGVIYTTDSLTGLLYQYSPKTGAFDTVVERGILGSPQGLVLDDTARYLYVADYIGGLYRVTLESGEVLKVNIEANVTDYGIDGLYRYGDELIAIQNGIRPHRVVALELSEDGLSITAGRTIAMNLDEFDEPTLGLVSGDDFYFVANSHWNRFDADNKLPEGLTDPIILRVSLLAY
jgi:sugar lactone lactonase YvrE